MTGWLVSPLSLNSVSSKEQMWPLTCTGGWKGPVVGSPEFSSSSMGISFCLRGEQSDSAAFINRKYVVPLTYAHFLRGKLFLPHGPPDSRTTWRCILTTALHAKMRHLGPKVHSCYRKQYSQWSLLETQNLPPCLSAARSVLQLRVFDTLWIFSFIFHQVSHY